MYPFHNWNPNTVLPYPNTNPRLRFMKSNKGWLSMKTNHSRTKAYSWQTSAPKNKLIYIYYLPAGRSVLRKTVPEVLSTARGRGPCSRPRAQFFSIRTDQGWQIIFLFFSCCFSKVKRVLLFSESNVLQARVKWTMKQSRLWHQSSKIRFFTLLKVRNYRKQYN